MSRAALASLVALAVLAARASAAGETPTKGVSTDGRQTLSCTEPGLCDLDTRECGLPLPAFPPCV